jgi:hypothetical protein
MGKVFTEKLLNDDGVAALEENFPRFTHMGIPHAGY